MDIIKNIDFSKIKNIAIVGLSDKPDRDSFKVGKFFFDHGFNIFPVNPNIKDFYGRKSFAHLTEIKEKIDVVDIFRPANTVIPIIYESIKIKAKIIWLQEGIINEEASKIANDAGIKIFMNQCLMKEFLNNV